MRRGSSLLSLSLATVVAACAGGPGSGNAGPAVLGIQVPEGGTASYVQADSGLISIDAGGQMIDVRAVSEATLDMAFANAADGVEVTATWRSLDATVTNPMGAPERADTDDVEGPLVFNLDRRGVATVVTLPELSGNAAQMVSGASMAHTFFPRLPGESPTMGMAWSDTIAFEAEEAGNNTVAEIIVNYTVVGDTLVDGRNLLKVDMTAQDDRTSEGVTQGMGFVQSVSGDVTGYFLWDLSAGMLHSMVQESEMFGTMEVDMAPFPLDISMRGKTVITLAGN